MTILLRQSKPRGQHRRSRYARDRRSSGVEGHSLQLSQGRTQGRSSLQPQLARVNAAARSAAHTQFCGSFVPLLSDSSGGWSRFGIALRFRSAQLCRAHLPPRCRRSEPCSPAWCGQAEAGRHAGSSSCGISALPWCAAWNACHTRNRQGRFRPPIHERSWRTASSRGVRMRGSCSERGSRRRAIR